jgi:hypothetical protein
MTVVNASHDAENHLSLIHELQLCNSALLYADEVTLVSPRAALLKNAGEIAETDEVSLLRILASVAPKWFPEHVEMLAPVIAALNQLPPRQKLPLNLRNEYDAHIRNLARGLRPAREQMVAAVTEMFQNSGYDQLQDAIDAGVLRIDDVEGAVVSDITETGAMVLGFYKKIEELLTDGGRYPLFDAQSSNIVRVGVEVGYFSPVESVRQLGADAAMADGLFDRLPNFQYATPREILDIRTELSGSLSAFRQGVRELTDDVDVAPEDPDFAHVIADAWNHKVVPALEEIEQQISENKSMTDLLKRTVKDPIGGGSVVGAVTLPSTLAVAAGPAPAYISAAGLLVGYGVTTTKALIDEYQEIKSAKKAQFYFLFGTNEQLSPPA